MEIDAIDIRLRREHISEPDLVDLAHTIKGGFLRHPIVLTPEHLLLDGERRLRSAKLAGNTHIQAYICYTLEQASNVMAKALADVQFQIPMTYSERCRSMELLWEWSAPARNKRRSDLARDTRRSPEPAASTSRKPAIATDQIAAAVGVSGGSLGRLRQIWRLTKSDDPETAARARHAMRLVDETGHITTYLSILKTGRPLEKDSKVRPHAAIRQRKVSALPRVDPVKDPRQQQQLLINAAVALSGINLGLAKVVQLSEVKFPPGDKERVVDSLTATGRLVRTLLRQLNAEPSDEGDKK